MVIDEQTYISVLQIAGYHCAYCGVGLDDKSAEVDFKTPWSLGGKAKVDNLAASCKECRKLKGHKTLEEFRAWIFDCITLPLDKAFDMLDKVSYLIESSDVQRIEQVLASAKIRLKRFIEEDKVVFYFEVQSPATSDSFSDVAPSEMN